MPGTCCPNRQHERRVYRFRRSTVHAAVRRPIPRGCPFESGAAASHPSPIVAYYAQGQMARTKKAHAEPWPALRRRYFPSPAAESAVSGRNAIRSNGNNLPASCGFAYNVTGGRSFAAASGATTRSSLWARAAAPGDGVFGRSLIGELSGQRPRPGPGSGPGLPTDPMLVNGQS